MYRTNAASALTRKANAALRAAGVQGVKVKSDGYVRGGTVTADSDAALLAAHAILSQSLKVSDIRTFSALSTRFYIME